MDTLSFKTISVNKETAKKEWVVIDATDQVVGRLCSKVAKLLRGKYKPTFTPHVDCGDNVIIINAAKAVFSGKKETDKIYTRYTGYPGGQRFNTPAELRKRPDGMDKIVKFNRYILSEKCNLPNIMCTYLDEKPRAAIKRPAAAYIFLLSVSAVSLR